MHSLELVGVRVELPANQPIVLLKERDGTRYLPIWIGAVEATAIAFALQGVETVDVLAATGQHLDEVRITDLRDGTFYAELVLTDRNGDTVEVSSRPSDAIAIAARLPDVALYSVTSVLEEAGVELDEETEEPKPEDQVREFREFLDSVSPEDFGEA
jgi:bifunctional DNase/RNase